jgi:hypothetical protein
MSSAILGSCVRTVNCMVTRLVSTSFALTRISLPPRKTPLRRSVCCLEPDLTRSDLSTMSSPKKFTRLCMASSRVVMCAPRTKICSVVMNPRVAAFSHELEKSRLREPVPRTWSRSDISRSSSCKVIGRFSSLLS